MKYRDPLIVLFIALLVGSSPVATAATTDEAARQAAEHALEQAAKAEQQAQLAAEHEKALAQVEKQRHEAEATMEKAREQLHQAAEQQAISAEESVKAREAQRAEMASMQEELNQARRGLRETSREIARVNREVAQARARSESSSFVYRTSERPVLGVILGDSDEVGIKVLGVSPDGPAERGGIQQGDVIIALGGRVLAAVDESGDIRGGLSVAMHEIKPNEPVIVSVERGDKTLDLTVVPEVREPLGWHTVTRFPTAPALPALPSSPSQPGRVITIERIVVPEIDRQALAEQIEQIRIEIDERENLMTNRVPAVSREYEFEFHDMSEMGDFALHDANMWFGLPLTQGLKLAEIDPGLGEYFKTDRGVLVLKARADNDLQLESGDVILQVGKTEVNSPAEFMRTLREFESGEELSIDIKRDRKNKTLKAVMPDSRTSFFAPDISTRHAVRINRHPD